MSPVADVAYRRAISFGEERLEINASDNEALSFIAFYYSGIGDKVKVTVDNAESGDIYDYDTGIFDGEAMDPRIIVD